MRALVIFGFPLDLSFNLSEEIQEHLKQSGVIRIVCNASGTFFEATKGEKDG